MTGPPERSEEGDPAHGGRGTPRHSIVRPRGGALAVDLRWFEDGSDLSPSDAPVTVWLVVPDAARDAALVAPWLSEAERTRRDGILHPRAFAEFLAGRRLLRTIMGHLAQVPPAAIELVENAHGAISLRASCGWQFNLSHTEGLLAFAVSRERVGVDVEWTTRPGRTVELADRYFAPAEIAALRALPEAAQRDRFFDLWTLKEAYIKARGMGLAIPLRDFAFALSDGIDIAVAPGVRDVPDERWQFYLGDIGDRHRLAVASSR